MQRGVSLSLPPAFSARVSRSARPETDILMKNRGGQSTYEGRAHTELHTNNAMHTKYTICIVTVNNPLKINTIQIFNI